MSKNTDSNQKIIHLGGWLRRLRTDRELPLRVVADASAMDIAHLHKIESGQRLPTESQAYKLAKFFEIEVTDILARRIAEKFRQEFADQQGATEAILMLAEEAGIYSTTTHSKRTARQ